MIQPPDLTLINALAEQTMRYPFKVWGFGEGIALEALWDVGRLTGNTSYQAFILALFDRWLARPIVEADHSAPGTLLLTLYQETGQMRYLERALALAQHMLALPRTTAGAALHRPSHPEFHDCLYVDCIEVDAPFLCKLGETTGDSTTFNAGIEQIEGYCTLLQDNASGLFFHLFDYKTQITNGAFWGRGNGWALLGLLKTLRMLDKAHPAYGSLRRRFSRLANTLVATQMKDGGWPTVLDQPDTYEESSLAAMFGVGLALGAAHGLLDINVQNTVERAWQRTLERIDKGTLQGVSVATPPGDAAHYAGISTGSSFPWGQGPALWFASVLLASKLTDSPTHTA